MERSAYRKRENKHRHLVFSEKKKQTHSQALFVLLLAAVHINKVTAKRRPRRIDASTGPYFGAFKKPTRPARKGRRASTWEVNSERTHPLPAGPARRPAPPGSLRRASQSRADRRTGNTATKIPSLCVKYPPWRCVNAYIVFCLVCETACERLLNVYVVIFCCCLVCTMRLYATLWMVLIDQRKFVLFYRWILCEARM